MKSYQGVCLHTMVGSLAGTDSMFQKDGTVGTESHFGVGEHGEIYQWVDTKYTADANYLGSGHVISIETADYGGSFGRWNTRGDNVPYWNAKQIAAIVKIIVWACKTHDIPIRMMANSRDRGIGYHAMGVPGNELPSKYKGTRYQWSKYAGKVCPGRKRISQVPGIVKLAQTGSTTPATSSEGILGMSKYSGGKHYAGQQKLTYNKWEHVHLNSQGDVSILTCNGHPFMAQTGITVEGLKPGESIQFRYIISSYKKGTKTKITDRYPKQEFVGTSGGTYMAPTQIGGKGKGGGGRSNRLRLLVWTNSRTAKITSIHPKSMKG
ncbi:N-acetylmuramoyl-L-alanine amidase [Brevibacterium sp. K11IcPPYGO002]|uniref:peptidoglycan recognition protein family protein n=1 Tax=Brevibacterium sp. K11IcPPYGO002 TaxID=3058837 RepID=UPI003D817EB3